MAPYPKNFITKVIARVDYQPILVFKEKPPSQFQEQIRARYPRFEHFSGVHINISGGNPPAVEPLPVAWRFIDTDKHDTIEVSANYFALTSTKFYRFSQFLEKFTAAYNDFIGIYKPSIVKRVGLRYINEICLERNPFVWAGFINDNLFATLNAFPDYQNQLSRAVHQMQFNRDSYKIIFNFGVHNSAYPNTIAKSEFILDYDCASEEECDAQTVLPTLNEFNNNIYDLFEKSIGDNLREIMSAGGVQ